MNERAPVQAQDTSAEVAALIATLHATGQRLEELTAGEVDTVADAEGRTFVLRNAQEQLRHHESRKQAAILNVLPANIALIDAQGIIVSVNEAWRRFADGNGLHAPGHGVGLNYLLACEAARGQDAIKAHAVATGIRAVLAGEASTYTTEYPCHSPTQQRWFLMTVTPLVDASAHGAVVMHLDISERVRIAQALDAQRIELRALFNVIPAMVWVKDTRNNIVRVNQRVANVAGKTIAAIEGKASLEIYPKDADRFFVDDLEVIRSGSPKLGIVETIVGADGTDLWVQTDKVPLIADDGTVTGIVVMATDITELKRAEGDLRESERRFSDMLDNVGLVSVMLDRRARIIYCNDFFLRLTGWQREEAVGMNWFDGFTLPEAVNSKANFEGILAERRASLHNESQLMTRSGEPRLIRWNNSVLRSRTGTVIGAASIGEDITDRKAAEAVLAQRATELERFHRLSVGRELQMVELKKQINALTVRAGGDAVYNLAFLESGPLQQSAADERNS
ncbi:MAG: PAS domain-containing protein [Lysobacteraceae bacterium]